MRFEAAWNELKSSVPKVDALFAQKLVQRAYRDIRDSRRWSFLCSETVISTPDQINAGTATVTKDSTNVVLDAVAQAALVGLTTNQLVERTFRAGTNLYNIVAYDGAGNLTIAYPFNGPSASGVSYFIYQPYILAPSDFLSWVSVIDPYAPMPIFNVTATKEELDAIDPQRGALGQPFKLATYRYEENLPGSNPPILDRYRFELWPAGIAYRQYPAIYQRKGVDLITGQSQPSIIPDELWMSRARYFGYEWCEANKGKHPELKGTNWMQLKIETNKAYQVMLAQASRQDEEIFIQNYPRSYMVVAGNTLGDQYYFNHAPYYGGGYW